MPPPEAAAAHEYRQRVLSVGPRDARSRWARYGTTLAVNQADRVSPYASDLCPRDWKKHATAMISKAGHSA